MLPFAVQQLVEGGGEGKGVLPDELVGSDTPGFGVLGIGVERDAGHIEEGGFFGYVAGVGHDTFGLVAGWACQAPMILRHAPRTGVWGLRWAYRPLFRPLSASANRVRLSFPAGRGGSG